MDFFKDKIVFPEMLKLLLLSFAWLGNSGMCVLVGGGRAVNRKHHPAERCDLRFGFPLCYTSQFWAWLMNLLEVNVEL